MAQQRMGDAAPVAGAIDCSKEELDKKWADAVYAVPTSFGFLGNEFVVDAIEATSRYLLPGSFKSDPENAPKYTPPKRVRLAGPMLKASLATTSDDLVATQSIEAQSYGVSATSDGWSSNPQHRPVEAQLLETPTVAFMNAAEDLSGMLKSDFNVALKLGEWSDEGCKKMGLPPSTADFMCVDGAEIGSVNLLMNGAKEGKKKIEKRPWLSGGVCTPHSLDLELEDIAKLPWVANDLAEVCLHCVVRCVRVANRMLQPHCVKKNHCLSVVSGSELSSSFVSTTTRCSYGVRKRRMSFSTLEILVLRPISSCQASFRRRKRRGQSWLRIGAICNGSMALSRGRSSEPRVTRRRACG